MPTAEKESRFVRVAQNLYRYGRSKTDYAVFRTGGKLRWKSLNTDDRKLGERRLRDVMKYYLTNSMKELELEFREVLAGGDTEAVLSQNSIIRVELW